MSRFLSLLRVSSTICVIAVLALNFHLRAVFAHDPHDVIQDIKLSPNYQQDKTAYCILFHQEVIKTEDQGRTWRKLWKGLDNRYPFSSIAVSPNSSKLVFLSSLGDGVYKSKDGGATWFKVNNGLGSLLIDRITISPDSPNIVFATSPEKGIYKTENGGLSWRLVRSSASKVTAIVHLAGAREHLFIGDLEGALHLSNDGGTSWQRIFRVPDADSITAIAISPSFERDKTILVGTANTGILKSTDGGRSFVSTNIGIHDKSITSISMSPAYEMDHTILVSTWRNGVFVSADGAETWVHRAAGLTKTKQADVPKYSMPHFDALSISRSFETDRTVFLAGFDGLFRSTDGGQTWIELNTEGGLLRIRRSIAVAGDATVAFGESYRGAYMSSDGGDRWYGINRGLNRGGMQNNMLRTTLRSFVWHYLDPNRPIHYLLAAVYSFALSPKFLSDKTLFATWWGRVHRSTDGGKHWTQTKVADLGVGMNVVSVSPAFEVDQTVYLFSRDGPIAVSDDGGKQFSVAATLDDHACTIFPYLVMTPNFHVDSTIYAVGYCKSVYKSEDRGYTWVSANNGVPRDAISTELAISPAYSTDQTAFLGTKKGLFVTKDGASHWTVLPGDAFGSDAYIEALALSSGFHEDHTLFVGVKGRGLFKSINGGKTFAMISDEVTQRIALSPSFAADQTIYAASDETILKSTDGGYSWNRLKIPITASPLEAAYLFFVTKSTRRLVLFSAGALAFALTLCLILGAYVVRRRKLRST